MALIHKSFDVKINIVYPFVSKTLPEKDSERINASNLVKYEAQPSIQETRGSLYVPGEGEGETNETRVKKIDAELEVLEDQFKRLEDKTEKAFANYTYEYDVTDPGNEAVATAEEEIFGVSTGIITQDMYKKVLELLDLAEEILVDATIENGGTLNVGAA